MRITQYKTMLDENKHNILVKEKSFNYSSDNIPNCPVNIVKLFTSVYQIDKQAEEYVYMIATDNKCHVLGVFEISHGTYNMSLVNPREVFIRALLCGACNFALVHNHPSGDCTPSKIDDDLYQKMKDASNIMGIGFMDSIIIGENENYYSYASNK